MNGPDVREYRVEIELGEITLSVRLSGLGQDVCTFIATAVWNVTDINLQHANGFYHELLLMEPGQVKQGRDYLTVWREK